MIGLTGFGGRPKNGTGGRLHRDAHDPTKGVKIDGVKVVAHPLPVAGRGRHILAPELEPLFAGQAPALALAEPRS